MKITWRRVHANEDETTSLVYVDRELMGFGLEDEFRAEKVAGETRIPAGAYSVFLRDEGVMTKNYAAAFPGLHKGMLHLQNVPGFEWIYIHMGNTDDHTEGCLLIAEQARILDGEVTIPNSRPAYQKFYRKVRDAAANQTLRIEIIDDELPITRL